MVALRMDREVLQGSVHLSKPDRNSGSETDMRKVSEEMEPQKRMELKLAQIASMKTQRVDGQIAAEEDGAVDVLRASERSEEEDVIDVSPSACTVSSLSNAKLETASRVRNMFIFDNSFTVLPSSIQNFKSLRKLKFFSNEVRTLPEELGELTQLEHLYLKICPAGLGSLPPLEKLRSLRALELHQVPARPSASTLSREIAQLHSLTRLSVCHFSISWVPAEIGTLKHLEELDLSFNKLKVLPKEFAGLISLKTLRVSSNKLVELPSELTNLPSLNCIDVAHNRLTSLDSLGLVSMTSLRALNAQFNKLQNTGDIPHWISCKLEGNEKLSADNTKSQESAEAEKEEYFLDWESPSVKESYDVIGGSSSPSSPMPFAGKSSSPPSPKGQTILRSRRGWKKQDNQQQRARQDRLNSSRKHRTEDHGDLADVANTDNSSDPEKVLELDCEDASTSDLVSSEGKSKQMETKLEYDAADVEGEVAPQNVRQNEDAVDSCKELQLDEEVQQGDDNEESFRDCQPEHSPSTKVRVVQVVANRLTSNEKNICRKAFSGDRLKGELELSLPEYQEDEVKVAIGGILSNGLPVAGVKAGRRQESDKDSNPKPSKRRRAVQDFSEVSFKYCTESFCGFDDRIHDGFYDAGRDRPFSSLAALEQEQPCFDSREVILVDREKDEDLDVMALSAQQLLVGLESSVDGERKVNVFQRMAVLALFVSDCFGGSDKTQNISNMRRAALGGTAGMPFVCSCSSGSSGNSVNTTTDKSNIGAVLPTVLMLCEGAVRFLKHQRQSNVLPIGSLSYGVCRHRAILLKYLCDRADPIIPCELVRGYLDYMPHAWNVILVQTSKGSTRMVVDACRPLDIRPEKDAEYFCRYIPLRRMHLPRSPGIGLNNLGSESSLVPVLHEDIGHGASGAVVKRCTFGNFTAAAKVRRLDAVAEGPGGSGKGLESSSLSELRMLCSLQPHPCIVAFYGHQLSSGFTASPDGTVSQTPNTPQLMIFMEYVRGGSLEGFLQGLADKGQSHMPPGLALHVARSVACALVVLHLKGIIHRDVKSSNVLIDLEATQDSEFSSPVVKLCDFDSAVPLQSSSSHTCYLAHRGVPAADVCVGTPRWIAPEVLRAMYGRHSYGLEADLWSFGCLLAELLTLKVPYAGLSESKVHSRIQMGQRPQLPPEIDDFRLPSSTASVGKETNTRDITDDSKILSILVRLFYSCTDPSPSMRPTATEVLNTLTTALTEKTCTTVAVTSVDVQFLQDETPEEAEPLDVPKGLLTTKAEAESPRIQKESCLDCSLAKKVSSRNSDGKETVESNVDVSNADSCNET